MSPLSHNSLARMPAAETSQQLGDKLPPLGFIVIVARVPHIGLNGVPLSAIEQTSLIPSFSQSALRNESMLAHRPAAPTDHRAFRRGTIAREANQDLALKEL